ncbi:DUF2274 domain-containing protein [Sphingobium sp. CCH11-B1]|uniref:DUF2274 domain-containing protein n=1 Tax=Sphingobium sp. CCH11-B1 TaxID=1768781 RepID=UPI00082963E6|nr:DUF2274 domain-containing protein [Sphingobium sp. CCH11-B1]
MTDIRLSRLPDRTPVKLAISIAPDLHLALADYATIYQQAYGDNQAIADLVPHMLAAFLASDRGFAKARVRISVQ